MRIVIDLQSIQAANRSRGIGRYSRSFTEALIRRASSHEIVLVVNGGFPNALLDAQNSFGHLLTRDSIRVWHTPELAKSWSKASPWQRRVAELIREAFIESLYPDVVIVSSLFEGYADAAITSVKGGQSKVPTAVILYDLIPLLRPHEYLSDPDVKLFYESKLVHLRHATLLLAISESSRQESIRHLGRSETDVVNISGAVGPEFEPVSAEREVDDSPLWQFGLNKPFAMYTGGIDPRKNIGRLILGFARLPREVRDSHQLAIVCAADQNSVDTLLQFAQDCGLSAGDLVVTGFVSDTELLDLYQRCKVFVFPSLHEGFGLPVLEAMACGRAVIASNTSSLPEVVQAPEALFDPTDVTAISAKLAQALCDDSFRGRLELNGLQQAAKFSWDATAQKALAALEALGGSKPVGSIPSDQTARRLKLAYVSPLPPEPSGISDYSADMVRELARHYDVDVVVRQDQVSDQWINTNCGNRTSEWFRANYHIYDRIVYSFGNSEFHSHMFELLSEAPGVVILHDFYLSSIVAHLDVHLRHNPGDWARQLYASHGYAATAKRYTAADEADVIWQYPTNLQVLQDALGIVVHSRCATELANWWYGPSTSERWVVIPLLRTRVPEIDRLEARRRLGISPRAFVICSFGGAGPTKQTQRMVDVCLNSNILDDDRSRLILVGEVADNDYGKALRESLTDPVVAVKATFTGRVTAEVYRFYLAAADIAIQLRSNSRGETSAAVLDCMNYGLATIVNACGSLAELPDDCVVKLREHFNDAELLQALAQLKSDPVVRSAVAQAGGSWVRQVHNPSACGEQLAHAIEDFYSRPLNRQPGLIAAVGAIGSAPTDDATLLDVSQAIARATEPEPAVRRLFVDISELAQRDAGSGIQRSTRNILTNLLDEQPAGYRVEPVYATGQFTYRFARQFTLNMLGIPALQLEDDPIDFAQGDIFLGLDLQPHLIASHRSFFQRLRNSGVHVYFVVYDLLPVNMPHSFHPGAQEIHNSWLNTVADGDGILAISRSVAEDVRRWMQSNRIDVEGFAIGWFHLGSDLDGAPASNSSSRIAEDLRRKLDSRPTFLMVGTLEPRKRHDQALAAFDHLWRTGHDVNLVIVGRQGWMVDGLTKLILEHCEFDHRLFWLDNAGDDLLEGLYLASSCLIAASEDEGFGLPIIEAARHGTSIIARNIPVFNEIAGEHAFYFDGLKPLDLATAVERWLDLAANESAPQSSNIQRMTWRESTQQLVRALGLQPGSSTAS